MSRKDQDRELTRDEVWVPPLHRLPNSWARDNAYLDYRILKLAGPLAVIYVVVLGAGLLLVFAGRGDLGIGAIMAAQAIFLVILLVAFLRARKAWRSARLRESDDPPRHPHRSRHR